MKSKKKKRARTWTRREKSAQQATPEFAETTMQFPIGVGSGIDALSCLDLTAAECAVLSVHVSQSNWDSGLTRWTSARSMAKTLGMSKSYVRVCEKRLIGLGLLAVHDKGWRGIRYKINAHAPVGGFEGEPPLDKNGKPLKMAVPFGKGSVFARLTAGDIRWKDLVVWLVLRRRSDWKTGITHNITIRMLAALCRLARRTLEACLQRLQKAGLLKRISASHARSVFQLYPKLPKVAKPKPAKKAESVGGCIRDGNFWMSRNKSVRQSIETNEIFQRSGRQWVPLRDRDRHKVPGAILQDLQAAVDISAQIPAHLRLRAAPN